MRAVITYKDAPKVPIWGNRTYVLNEQVRFGGEAVAAGGKAGSGTGAEISMSFMNETGAPGLPPKGGSYQRNLFRRVAIVRRLVLRISWLPPIGGRRLPTYLLTPAAGRYNS